jgi:ubiquinone/menaquinone biosynthesis C-methylase UbiE
MINIAAVRILFIIVAVLSGTFLVYISYAFWLFWKRDGEIQRQVCDALLNKVEWDGLGKALDIGTGSGRIAILLAKRYKTANVTGVDLWGNPWTYSRNICYRNAELEGVRDRTEFQRGSATDLPFKDGEYDLVASNFVFHSVRVLNSNRKNIIKEALRVLKDGGVFAFQDLFNKQFYGDIDLLKKEMQTWGLKEIKITDTSEFVYIPVALRVNHMAGNSKIIYGIK